MFLTESHYAALAVLGCWYYRTVTFHVVSQTHKFHRVLLFTSELGYSPQSGHPRSLGVLKCPQSCTCLHSYPVQWAVRGWIVQVPPGAVKISGPLHGEFWCFSRPLYQNSAPENGAHRFTAAAAHIPLGGKAVTSRLDGPDLVSDLAAPSVPEGRGAGVGCRRSPAGRRPARV